MQRRIAIAAAAAFVISATGARAYNEALHSLLTARAFAARAEWRTELLAPPTADDLAAFRAELWNTAATLPDAALRAKFLQRFPTVSSLDAWAFKELLLLDPAATVHGFDVVTADARPVARADLTAIASRWPDDDERNRHRYFRDPRREVVKAADGSPTPYDPRTLWLGSLSGPSSQGHAHYGLLPSGYSDDPEVLKGDPRHFAMPNTIRAFGQDFAQIYSDLSLFAEGSGLPAKAWLQAAFAGAAFHHLEDLANQIHTVQVGTYEFFEAAFIQSKLRDLSTLGGLLGPRRSLEQLGLRLVANHHLFSEDLFARRVAEAAQGQPGPDEVRGAVEGIAQDEPAFAAAAAEAARLSEGDGKLARRLADALVEASSHEGPEVYSLAWRLSTKTLRDGAGHEYQSPPDDPDRFLVAAGPERDRLLARFYALDGRGLTRAGTALRAWGSWHSSLAPRAAALRPAIVQRLLATLLPIHEQAEALRATYRPAGPAAQTIAWGYPAGLLVALLAIGLLLRRALR